MNGKTVKIWTRKDIRSCEAEMLKSLWLMRKEEKLHAGLYKAIKKIAVKVLRSDAIAEACDYEIEVCKELANIWRAHFDAFNSLYWTMTRYENDLEN